MRYGADKLKMVQIWNFKSNSTLKVMINRQTKQ